MNVRDTPMFDACNSQTNARSFPISRSLRIGTCATTRIPKRHPCETPPALRRTRGRTHAMTKNDRTSWDGAPTTGRGPSKHVASAPYPWPFDGDLRRENTALVVIDMQADFCGKGGYIDLLGYDISLTRACIEPIRRVLAAARERGFTVFHTREGHRPDLSDLPANKRGRSRQTESGGSIGGRGRSGVVLAESSAGSDTAVCDYVAGRATPGQKTGKKGRSCPGRS